MNRNPRSTSNKRHRLNGPSNRAAGARTSVTAPLDLNQKKLVPTGSQETWIGKEPSAGNTTESTAPLSRPPAAGRSFASTRFDAQTKVHGSAKKPLWIHLTFRRPSTSSIHPSHVLKGHSFIAQGSCAALPWVARQPDRFIPEGDGFTRAAELRYGRNSTHLTGVRRLIDEGGFRDSHVSEPRWGSCVLWMALTQGSRCAANPGLSKSSPSGNGLEQRRCAMEPVMSLRGMKEGIPPGSRTPGIRSELGPQSIGFVAAHSKDCVEASRHRPIHRFVRRSQLLSSAGEEPRSDAAPSSGRFCHRVGLWRWGIRRRQVSAGRAGQ